MVDPTSGMDTGGNEKWQYFFYDMATARHPHCTLTAPSLHPHCRSTLITDGESRNQGDVYYSITPPSLYHHCHNEGAWYLPTVSPYYHYISPLYLQSISDLPCISRKPEDSCFNLS